MLARDAGDEVAELPGGCDLGRAGLRPAVRLEFRDGRELGGVLESFPTGEDLWTDGMNLRVDAD